MRVSVLFSALSLVGLGVGVFVVACGDTASTPELASVDAGLDASGDAAKADAGADASKPDAAPACDTSTDLTAAIPDAGLGGVSSTGACLGCLKTSCGTVIDNCNKDCNCRVVVADVLGCVLKGGKSLTDCVLSGKVAPTAKTIQLAAPLQSCLLDACNDPCAVDELLDAGPDAK